MTGPRKLLAAAAFTMTAACSTGRAPAPRTASYPAPVTAAVATTTPPVTVAEPLTVAEPAMFPAVEFAAVTEPVVEAAAPRCDEHGRPLAGNVMTKKQVSIGECK